MEKNNFWQKYKQYIIFIIVFAVAFLGTRALMSMYHKSKAKPESTIIKTP